MWTRKILLVSDLHCGHRTGLTHPDFSRADAFSEARLSQHNWWHNEISISNEQQRFTDAIWNGDLIDGDGIRNSAVELLYSDRNVQVEMAVKIIDGVAAKNNYIVYGTGSHTGKSEDFEKQIADRIGAKWHGAILDIEFLGLKLNVKHKVGNSSAPVSRFNSVTKAQVLNVWRGIYSQKVAADLVIRSHVHRFGFIKDKIFSACTLPGLQGPGSIYGQRECDGLNIDYGFCILYINDKKDWMIEDHIIDLTTQNTELIVIK